MDLSRIEESMINQNHRHNLSYKEVSRRALTKKNLMMSHLKEDTRLWLHCPKLHQRLTKLNTTSSWRVTNHFCKFFLNWQFKPTPKLMDLPKLKSLPEKWFLLLSKSKDTSKPPELLRIEPKNQESRLSLNWNNYTLTKSFRPIKTELTWKALLSLFLTRSRVHQMRSLRLIKE